MEELQYLCVIDSTSTCLRCIMARGSHGGRYATVDGEYECDKVARNVQLEAFYQ